jgi:hypothetical protein
MMSHRAKPPKNQHNRAGIIGKEKLSLMPEIKKENIVYILIFCEPRGQTKPPLHTQTGTLFSYEYHRMSLRKKSGGF